MAESVLLYFPFFAACLFLYAHPNEIALHLIHGLVILEARALEGAAAALMSPLVSYFSFCMLLSSNVVNCY